MDRQTDGRTDREADRQAERERMSDITKIIVDFRNFANWPNILSHFDCLLIKPTYDYGQYT